MGDTATDEPNSSHANPLKYDNQLKSICLDQEDNKDALYNPYTKPPNLEICYLHNLAQKVGMPNPNPKSGDNLTVCPCCGYSIDYQKVNLCCSPIELGFLGPGYPLYFIYARMCMLLLIFAFIFNGAYKLYIYAKGDACSKYDILSRTTNLPDIDCNESIIINESLANIQNPDMLYDFRVSNILNLVYVIIAILTIICSRRWCSQVSKECDNLASSPSDYTIQVKNLPENITDEQIQQFYENRGLMGKKCEVVHVLKAYDVQELLKFQNKKNQLVTRLKSKMDPIKRAQIEDNVLKLESQIHYQMENHKNEKQPFTRVAFVTFRNEQVSKAVMSRWTLSVMESLFYKIRSWFGGEHPFIITGTRIYARRAPEPTDVKWENLGIKLSILIKYRLMTLIATFLCLALFFGLLLGIKLLQELLLKTTDSKAKTQIISGIASFLVVVVNKNLRIILHRFAVYEKYDSWTDYTIHASWRLGLAEFINTAILTLLIDYLKNTDVFYQLWKHDSLVYDIFYIYLSDSFFNPLLNYFDIFYLRRLYRRFKIKKNPNYNEYNQGQANEIFAGPNFDLSGKYGVCIKTLYFSLFYSNLIPYGTLISALGLLFNYVVDKYLLLRRCSKPKELGTALSAVMINFAELSIVVFAVGNIYFERLLTGKSYPDSSFFNLLSLLMAVVFLLLPTRYFAKWTLEEYTANSNENYEDAVFNFETDYERTYPITQEEANKAWFEKIGKRRENNQIANTKKRLNEHIPKSIHSNKVYPNEINYTNSTLQLIQDVNMHPNPNIELNENINKKVIVSNPLNSTQSFPLNDSTINSNNQNMPIASNVDYSSHIPVNEHQQQYPNYPYVPIVSAGVASNVRRSMQTYKITTNSTGNLFSGSQFPYQQYHSHY